MPDSKAYEAADMLEQFADMFRDHPEQLIEAAESRAMFRHSLAGYLHYLASSLRTEEDRGGLDGKE